MNFRPPCLAHTAMCMALALTMLLAACASGGGTMPANATASGLPSDGAAAAAPDTAGPLTKALRAIGLAKKATPHPTATRLAVRLYTAPNLNAGNSQHPLALVLKVYELRSLDRFNDATFDDFLDDGKTKVDLGGSLIDSRQMLLLPGQRYVSNEVMPPGTHYIGFVALFRGPAARRWRFAYDVSKSLATGITLGAHACALSSTSGTLVTQLTDDAGSLASVRCPDPDR